MEREKKVIFYNRILNNSFIGFDLASLTTVIPCGVGDGAFSQ
jgi:hypothetical protein